MRHQNLLVHQVLHLQQQIKNPSLFSPSLLFEQLPLVNQEGPPFNRVPFPDALCGFPEVS